MMYLQRMSLISSFCAASILAGCASNSKPEIKPINDRADLQTQSDATYAVPPQPRLRDKLTSGAAKGTAMAAKGSVQAVKGVANITVGGVGMAAKGAVVGARIGGRAAVGTGEVIVNGTRQTASRVKDGMDFITTAPAAKDAASPVGNKTLTDAALSPLSDFNIRKRERPEVLMELEDEDIYHVDAEASCEWYDVRIAELDDALGEDYDVAKEKASMAKKIGKNSRSAALSGVASAAGTYIPGRGIVRALSGAKARQKKTRQIYQKGVARRAFLKGVAMTQGCEGY